ncbi:MAG TPA: hypothetical protein VL997_15035 [Dyella sp.]|nr:hypothetical protein [Dyella sp.]
MRSALLIFLLALPMLAQAASPTVLSAADVPALVKPPTHGERIIALWALDCAYCEANLEALATLQKAHPHDVELVTVATDNIAQADAIEQRLQAAGVAEYPAHAYADAAPDRINFLIDPSWGGETPRVLVIRADGSRVGISGALTAAQLQKLQ